VLGDALERAKDPMMPPGLVELLRGSPQLWREVAYVRGVPPPPSLVLSGHAASLTPY